VKLSEYGVEAFLKFIYYSDVADAVNNPKIALQLLEAGHKYDIGSLETSMQDLFFQQPSIWYKDKLDVLVQFFQLTRKMKGNRYFELKHRVGELIKS